MIHYTPLLFLTTTFLIAVGLIASCIASSADKKLRDLGISIGALLIMVSLGNTELVGWSGSQPFFGVLPLVTSLFITYLISLLVKLKAAVLLYLVPTMLGFIYIANFFLSHSGVYLFMVWQS